MAYASGPLHLVLNGQSPQRARMAARASDAMAATSASRVASPAYAPSMARVTFQHAFAPFRTTADIPSSAKANIARRCIIMSRPPIWSEADHAVGKLEQVIPDAGVNIIRANCFGRRVSKATTKSNPLMGCGVLPHPLFMYLNGNPLSRLSGPVRTRESHSGGTLQLAAPSAPSLGAAVFLRRHLSPSKSPAFMPQRSGAVTVITEQSITGTRA